MGTKYSGVSISGYNSSPPADDGSVADSNKVQWQKHLDKIGGPLKTGVEAVNTALVTALAQDATSTTATIVAGATHHNQIIEIAGTVSTVISVTLSDAATMAAGYIVNVHNLSAVEHLLARATGADTINGTASNVPIPAYSQIKAWVNASADGYLVSHQNNIFSGGIRGTVTLATEQASTSGTSIDFTGIPTGTKKIIISFLGVSTNGTSSPIVQIGVSGGIETSGYVSNAAGVNNSGSLGSIALTSSGLIVIASHTAAKVLHGQMTLVLENASQFTWVASGSLISSSDTDVLFFAGSKSLSAELDRVRITTVNGSDTFDAGAINISYE